MVFEYVVYVRWGVGVVFKDVEFVFVCVNKVSFDDMSIDIFGWFYFDYFR